MGIPAVISYFDAFEGDNPWAFLSNFYQGEPIRFQQHAFLTGEHMFQALKARSRHDLMKVVAAPSPAEAKQVGKHMLRLRGDWERVKYDAMRLVLACKFKPGRDECGWLLDTEDALLVEGTTWGDRVWGVDLEKGALAGSRGHPLGTDKYTHPGDAWVTSPGRNWLGTLLMARRAELRAALATGLDFNYDEVWRFVRYEPPQADR